MVHKAKEVSRLLSEPREQEGRGEGRSPDGIHTHTHTEREKEKERKRAAREEAASERARWRKGREAMYHEPPERSRCCEILISKLVQT